MIISIISYGSIIFFLRSFVTDMMINNDDIADHYKEIYLVYILYFYLPDGMAQCFEVILASCGK